MAAVVFAAWKFWCAGMTDAGGDPGVTLMNKFGRDIEPCNYRSGPPNLRIPKCDKLIIARFKLVY